MDLVIRRARLRGEETLKDIGIEGDRIVAVREHIEEKGTREIDAAGKLTTPSFVDPHIHLDKTLIVETVRPNVSGTLNEAIEIIWERKREYTVEEIVERAGRVVKEAVRYGTTAIRTHVDVDTIGGLTPLEGLLETRTRYGHLVDLQIVAFPQEGIIQDAGTEELMWKAMEMGADVVGGMPYNEMIEADSIRHIDIAFEIAKEYDADIDMHVDETDDPAARTLQHLAAKTIKEGWHGRVTAGHTCALAAYDDAYADKVIGLLQQAQMHMITNPVTNLMIQGRLDKQPKRRGITRVKELMEAGVNVAFGQDCIKDTFYPFGKADLLEVALVSAHAAHMSLPHEIEAVFDMPTINAPRILGLENHQIREGGDAEIVIINCETPWEAIRLQPERLYVIHQGKVVAQERRESQVFE